MGNVHRWRFILHPDDCWSWQRLNADGSVDDVSRIYLEFGKAVANAIANGFVPKKHHWVVAHADHSVSYAPGAEPVVIKPVLPVRSRAL
jgi:hypothetical protein